MKRLALHLTLWAAYALVEFAANLPHFSNRRMLAEETLFFLPVIALPFYLAAYVLVPNLLWKGRKQLFWLACAVLFLLVMIIRSQWSYWYGLLQYGEGQYLPFSKISKNLFRDYAVIGFAVSLKVIRDWDRKDRLAARLQVEKRDAELQFLRAQIHPHFLFNTLNNIYGLALKQSSHTPDGILRLSGLLDFILYECNAERIPIQKEITLIRHYTELERLRFDERLDLAFRHDNPPEDLLIAPLLLLPFVENAFKHGANASNEKVYVKIDLSAEKGKLHFQVENSKTDTVTKNANGAKGIGLRNVEKRLELLYPGRFVFAKSDDGSVFRINLTLDL